MFIQFKVANFRSFKETQVFSMVASKFSERLSSNTFDPQLNSFDERLLRSSAIYGPNASGKTNFLRAVAFMQNFVLNSFREINRLPYEPFKFSSSTRNSPSEFEIAFVQAGIRYEYGFTLAADKIEKEWLIEFENARGRTLFKRTYEKKTKKYKWQSSRFLKGSEGQRSLWQQATRPNALFLSTAVQLNNLQLKPVFAWFQSRLVVIAEGVGFNPLLTIRLLEEQNGKDRVLSFLKEADFDITDVAFTREPLPSGHFMLPGRQPFIEYNPGQPGANLLKSKLFHPSDDETYAGLDLEDESHGTQNFFNSIGGWLNVFKNAEVLLLDEIEASFHPLLVRFLVGRFHSDQINSQNAQLIFTTHNTSFLDQELLRRDQIWFVEKGESTGSGLYPLSDFKVRKEDNLERAYLRGRYGSIPFLTHLENEDAS